MQFSTSGDIRRIDVDPVLELLPALQEEWLRLRFDATGRVMNPLSGVPQDTLVLTQGRHRQPSARYRVTTPTVAGSASDGETTHLVTLHHDDEHRLAFSVTQEPELWSVDVDLHHGARPRVVLVGRLDLRAVPRADGTPGGLDRLFEGPAGATATVDLGALEGPSSPLVVADGRANRFHGDACIEVGASGRRWRVDGRAALRGRGIGRVVLLLARRRLRRAVGRGIRSFWGRAEERISDVERDLDQLRSSVEREGGPAAFVHRTLWDPAFDPGPPLARG